MGNCSSSSKGKENMESCFSPPSLAEEEVELDENPDEFSKQDLEVAEIFLKFQETVERHNQRCASAAQSRPSAPQPRSSANRGGKRKRHCRPPSNGEKPKIPSSPSTNLSLLPSISDSAQKKPSQRRAPRKKKSRREEGNDMAAEVKAKQEKPQHESSPALEHWQLLTLASHQVSTLQVVDPSFRQAPTLSHHASTSSVINPMEIIDQKPYSEVAALGVGLGLCLKENSRAYNLPDLNIPVVAEEPNLNMATAVEPTQIIALVGRRFQIKGRSLVRL
ncbi:uncharacterized protein LOC131235201 [Magnolia sinica]|uniref:uncharacterized protein LOC131235201 n=1 Tax=Magnolia sinica TaxID=86752 RepID=UPI00265AC10E|nr:uncharacterized protein LOC131235201 [Magnolia sinica]